MRNSIVSGLLATSLISFGAATPAAADSFDTQSTASADSARAVAELAEAGVRTIAGVVAVPLSVAAGGSAVAGVSVAALGAAGVDLATDGSVAAGNLAHFANEPLLVSDEVIVASHADRPAAQDAPNVPFDAQGAAK